MGTVPICSKSIEIESETTLVEVWTTTDQLSLGEDGEVGISWVLKEINFYAAIPNWIFNDSYLERFFFALENDENFARQFEIKTAILDKSVDEITIRGAKVAIDREIAKAIKSLNERGFVTINSCRGNFFEEENHSICAYLAASSLPESLVQVAREAGFVATQTGIWAHFTKGAQMHANKNFCRMLNDWANNALAKPQEYVPIIDPDYRRKIRDKFCIPENVKHQFSRYKIKQFQKIKNHKFKNFASLRSGRDGFTKMKLDQLVSHVDNDKVMKIEQNIPTNAARASALRWVLRGLSTEQAIQKAKVDEEINQNRKMKRAIHR